MSTTTSVTTRLSIMLPLRFIQPTDGAGSNQLGSTNLNGLRRQNVWFKRCGTKNTAILTSSSLKSISLSNQGSLRIPSKSTSTDHEPSHQLPPHYLDQATMNLLLGRRPMSQATMRSTILSSTGMNAGSSTLVFHLWPL